ncbi:hypothetical protein HDU97_009269 [Phlyctochytrium planicorne]|nr:hypothetical protein HDU97_009269 [Phlyctochytrium planicorne]
MPRSSFLVLRRSLKTTSSVPMPIESPRLLPPDSAPPVRPNNPTAAELEVYKEAVDAYKVKGNHDKRNWDAYCQRMSHWRHFSNQNAKAVSILHRCFSREDLERDENGVKTFIDRIETCVNNFKSSLDGNSGTSSTHSVNKVTTSASGKGKGVKKNKMKGKANACGIFAGSRGQTFQKTNLSKRSDDHKEIPSRKSNKSTKSTAMDVDVPESSAVQMEMDFSK